MRGGQSGCTGIILYDTDKHDVNAVYGYYEGDKITIEKGNFEELKKRKTASEKMLKRKDKLQTKLFVMLALITLGLIIGTFVLTSFIKGLFLSLILIAAYIPTLGLLYANINLYEADEDYQQFRRYHGCEHACLEMLSKRKELTLENLKSSGIYDSECGTVYMGYFLTLIGVITIVGLNIQLIGFLKAVSIVLATIILLFINVFNPKNPYKLLQRNVVSRPTEKEYVLGLELIKNFKEL